MTIDPEIVDQAVEEVRPFANATDIAKPLLAAARMAATRASELQRDADAEIARRLGADEEEGDDFSDGYAKAAEDIELAIRDGRTE